MAEAINAGKMNQSAAEDLIITFMDSPAYYNDYKPRLKFLALDHIEALTTSQDIVYNDR